MPYEVGNPGPGLRQAHTYGGVEPVNPWVSYWGGNVEDFFFIFHPWDAKSVLLCFYYFKEKYVLDF